MYCLHGFIDDATHQITGLYLSENECMQGYLEVTRQTLKNFRIPLALYADGSSIFFKKYGYNLEYMLNSNDATDEQKQEKISMLKYTYEQVLSSQAEQVDTKANNIDNLSSLGKLLSNNFVQTQQKNNLKAI